MAMLIEHTHPYGGRVVESRGLEEGADARTVQEGDARHNENYIGGKRKLSFAGSRVWVAVVGSIVLAGGFAAEFAESPTFNLGGAACAEGWRAPVWPMRCCTQPHQ